jgi:hypothetical protein
MIRFDLAALLTPLSIEEFRCQVLGRRPLDPSYDTLNRDRTRLFDWDSLNNVLATAAAVCGAGPESPIEVVVAGRRLGAQALCAPARQGQRRRVDSARVTHALRGGGRLGVQHLETFDPAVADLCDDISRRLRVSPQARLWACWSSPWPPRFEAVSDDVIVVQLAGRCRWDVRNSAGGSSPTPNARILEAGAIAHVPRAWSVRMTPVEFPVMQMLLALTPPAEDTFRHWVGARLLEADDSLREPLPSDPQYRAAEEAALLARLAEACSDPVRLTQFHAEQDAAAFEARPTFGLPWTATRSVLPPNEVVLKLNGPRLPRVEPAAGGAVFYMRGKRFKLGAAVSAALSPLFEGRTLSVGELVAAGPPVAVREALVDLLLAGHIAPAAG